MLRFCFHTDQFYRQLSFVDQAQGAPRIDQPAPPAGAEFDHRKAIAGFGHRLQQIYPFEIFLPREAGAGARFLLSIPNAVAPDTQDWLSFRPNLPRSQPGSLHSSAETSKKSGARREADGQETSPRWWEFQVNLELELDFARRSTTVPKNDRPGRGAAIGLKRNYLGTRSHRHDLLIRSLFRLASISPDRSFLFGYLLLSAL